MAVWIKTARGWVLRQSQDSDFTPPSNTINARPNSISYDRDVSQGSIVKLIGTKAQRKLSVCVSEFITHIDLISAVTDVRRQAYLFDLMMLLMHHCLGKLSGASHRQLFKILETMVEEALKTEIHIDRMKRLLVCTMKSLLNGQETRVGSKSLWNRHIHTVSNLCTKVDQFRYTERKDDGLACMMDLPKECIREILLKLSDHRDIVHLGATCRDMYYLTEDSSLWQNLVQYHFTEKQINTFVEDAVDSSASVWQQLHVKCFKKFGLKQPYSDQLVVCSACKTLHWVMSGHNCWTADDNPNDIYLEPISPQELYEILFVNN